ncbi:MAG: hypothetical protein ACXWUG_19315 [Polyangiales bacterium]
MRRALLAAAILMFPARAHAGKSCTEVSDIVGERHCSRFGDFWAHERTIPIVLGLGMMHGSLSPDDRSWSANFGKNMPTAYEFKGRSLGTSVGMWGPDLRIHAFPTRWLYLGTDWAMLFGHGDTSSFRADGYEIAPASGVNVIDGRFAFVTGLRTPLTAGVSLRVELLTGLELVTLRQIAAKPGEAMTAAGASHVDFLLSTRFGLDFWNTPWTTLGVWMGTKPLHVGDLDFGLNFSIHGRPHDG